MLRWWHLTLSVGFKWPVVGIIRHQLISYRGFMSYQCCGSLFGDWLLFKTTPSHTQNHNEVLRLQDQKSPCCPHVSCSLYPKVIWGKIIEGVVFLLILWDFFLIVLFITHFSIFWKMCKDNTLGTEIIVNKAWQRQIIHNNNPKINILSLVIVHCKWIGSIDDCKECLFTDCYCVFRYLHSL